MFQRNERLSELIQQQLSDLIRGVKDPGIAGLVTITGLDLGRDRKTARAYFSVLGSLEQRASTAKALGRASEYLRYQLKLRLRLKVIPRIEFAYDETPGRAHRIEEILRRIETEREGRS